MRSGGALRLRLSGLQEAEEGGVLGEQRLDLGDAGAGPVLEPGLAEIVLDLVQTSLAHGRKYRHKARTAPWAEWLIRGARGPILPILPSRPWTASSSSTRAPAEALRALRSWPLGPTRSESRRISWNPVMIRPSWPVGCRPVLVANNAYALDPPTTGARERLG